MALTNYWWLLVWLFTGGIFLGLIFPKQREKVCGKLEERWAVFPAVLLVLPYIIWAGFRGDDFGDTYFYRSAFQEAPAAISQMGEYLNEITKDKGFSVLTVLIKCIIGNLPTVYFLIIAVIEMIVLAMVFRRYSCNYWMSIFIFVASTEYMSWFHNGIRQFMAVVIILLGTDLIIKKKYLPMICLILLASTMHASALLMIPIIFIVQGKAWNKKTLLCILTSVLVLVYVDQFTDVLDALVSNTQYSNMVTDWQEWQDDGTNPVRVFIYSIPAILSIVGKRLVKKEDEFVNILINFSLLTSAIAVVSMATSGIFIGRLIIYPGIFSTALLLPWEIEHLFTKESRRIFLIIATVCYILFFYYQMHFAWGII